MVYLIKTSQCEANVKTLIIIFTIKIIKKHFENTNNKFEFLTILKLFFKYCFYIHRKKNLLKLVKLYVFYNVTIYFYSIRMYLSPLQGVPRSAAKLLF